MTTEQMTKEEIIEHLNSKDSTSLYEKSDAVRKENKGDGVHLRGILEFSNICRKKCNYCGISLANRNVMRYRMDPGTIVKLCGNIKGTGIKTVVLQSGEDPYYTKEMLGHVISDIKKSTDLFVTLSVGERDEETFAYWKSMGMDRYLLRFETSNRRLFGFCHPDDDLDERVNCIKTLKKLGVETGSGFLIGLPGQTAEELADDIIFCTELGLDMIGVGPFISHPDTHFGAEINPFNNEIFYKVIALLRILNPDANIPATTAFDAIQNNGRDLALQRGANVFMPNVTPLKYRKKYLLYPGKPCIDETDGNCAVCAEGRIKGLGRQVAVN
jgi:biotin synthase